MTQPTKYFAMVGWGISEIRPPEGVTFKDANEAREHFLKSFTVYTGDGLEVTSDAGIQYMIRSYNNALKGAGCDPVYE